MADDEMSEVGSAYLSIRGNDSKLTADLQQIRQQTLVIMSSIASQGGSLLSGMFTGVLAGPALQAISSPLTNLSGWVSKAIEGESAMARFSAVLAASGQVAGYTGEQLKQMSEYIAQTTTFSKGAATAAEEVLLRFRNIRGDVFKDAMLGATNLAAVMRTDLPGAAEIIGRALQNPEHGLMTLERQGIALDASQKQAAKSMLAMGDLAGAQKVILGALSSQYGDAAERMKGTTQGTLDELSKTWNSLGKEIGTALLPAITATTEGLTVLVGKVRDIAAPAVRDLGVVIKEIVAGAKDLTSQWSPELDSLSNVFSTATKNIKLSWDITTTALGLSFSEFMDLLNEDWTYIQAGANATWEMLKEGWHQVTTNWDAVLDQVVLNFQAQFAGLKAGWDAIWAGENPLEAMTNAMKDTLAKAAAEGNAGVGVGNATADAFLKGWNDIMANSDAGPSGMTKELKKDLDALMAQFNQKRAEAGLAPAEKAKLPTPGVTDKVVSEIKVSMAKDTLEGLHDSIQGALKGENEEIPKAQLNKLEEIKQNGQDVAPILRDIKDQLGKGVMARLA